MRRLLSARDQVQMLAPWIRLAKAKIPLTFQPFDTRWNNGIMARHAVDGRPVGHLHWHPDGEIDSVRVHPELHRNGIATAMLDHARADPQEYESEYPIYHSHNLTSAGRAWANSDPTFRDPGDARVEEAEEDPSQWAWTAVKDYVPLRHSYTGQNEKEMGYKINNEREGINMDLPWPQAWSMHQMDVSDPTPEIRTSSVVSAWPKKWGNNHPNIPWDKRWSPTHPQHIPAPWE